MKRGIIRADRGYLRKEAVDDRVFSAFVEHAGNVIYNGIYQPEHPLANADGFREDVIQLVKELHLAGIRYPGGNFICSYRWEDTVVTSRRKTGACRSCMAAKGAEYCRIGRI